jgi:threonine dehydratase
MIELETFEAAAVQLVGLADRTPVSRDPVLSWLVSGATGQAWLKWENRQPTASFKLRGAFNAVLQLSEEEKQAGVVTASAGNHGLALAHAARQAGVSLTVYVPQEAPKKKVDGLRQLGAALVFCSGGYGGAERAALAAAASGGVTFVSPYNQPAVIAGAGTIGLELLEQVPELDTALVPVGGGGLISGVGLALKARRPEIRIIGVQGETSAVLHADWQGRGINTVRIEPTLADGLAGEVDPESITRGIVRQVVDDFILVSEDEIAEAIAYLYRAHDQVVEGSGAVGVAAILTGKFDPTDRVVGLIISGGNIDPEPHEEILARFADPSIV